MKTSTAKKLPTAKVPCGETITLPGSADDYPHQKGLSSFGLHGLEFLRTIDDRVIAQMSYEMHFVELHCDTCARCRWMRRKAGA